MRNFLTWLCEPLFLKLTAYMGSVGMILYGGGKGGGADAPNYEPLARASEEAARIGAELGREQLAQNKEQYDTNMAVARPVIAAQLELMQQTKAQGDDYYKYMVEKQRPVEDALNNEAMTGKVDGATQTAMDEARDRAIADTRAGTTQQANMIARQGIRYGWSPERMAAMAKSGATANATAQAAAANGAAGAERAKNWARRLDVAGLYRGMPGASQGAYTLANQSGNAAVGNQNQTSAQYLNGISAGNSTIMQGQGQKISGLGSILNSQTSIYNSSQSNGGGDPVLGMIGTGLGAWAGGGFKMPSDRRLKENVDLVGCDEETGLNIYEFNYIGDGKRFRGVMADEVEKINPDAVETMDNGYMIVDYSKIGMEMTEVSHG